MKYTRGRQGAPEKARRQRRHHYRKGTLTKTHEQYVRMKPERDPALKEIFSRIGRPKPAPFTPDSFQEEALAAIKKTDCLVIAPTGAGKTWIAEKAIEHTFNGGGRSWYASPLKALTNSKWVEFGAAFHEKNVGILTGDTKENSDAPVIVGTTEILRNQLYDAMHRGEDFDCDLVILDEAHYLGDDERGVVWEEIMMYLPPRINLLLLSATVGNGREIASWLGSLRKKTCVVVEEDRRPVPLYPLFLHPSGRLMPLLRGKKIFDKVSSYLEKEAKKGRARYKLPPFDEIITVLRKLHLLPAIFFLKSREECNVAVSFCRTHLDRKEEESLERDLDEILSDFPYLRNHRQFESLYRSRVGAHHGGQLPAWKLMVETMMKKGHLDAVFATSTVAAGVNFPARTVVLFNSDQFNGHEFLPLNATAFHQMTGRAGRRGQDKIGFMLAFPGKFMDITLIKDLTFKKPEKIKSRIRNDFSMILNLLLSHRPEEIKDIFERSLANYQDRKKKKSIDLIRDFERHLDFLISEGFVRKEGHLTEEGEWTSQLRLDQPLLIAECIRKGAFPEGDEALLAAIVAIFVYDRNQEITIPKKKVPEKIQLAYGRVIKTVTPLLKRMKRAGFHTAPLPFWPSIALYDWARGSEWEKVTKKLMIADGDLAMLISRTADNLNQISSLKDSHPDIAELASKGKNAILREPLIFD
jgi:ATP-dependent RNA helicase HelY